MQSRTRARDAARSWASNAQRGLALVALASVAAIAPGAGVFIPAAARGSVPAVAVTAATAPGDEIWASRTSFGQASSTALTVDHDGNAYVVGSGDQDISNNPDVMTWRVGSSESGGWTRFYAGSKDGPASDNDWANDVAVDPTGPRLYVAGATESDSTGSAWGLVAYTTDGTERWVRRLDGAGHAEDYATSVAVSPTTGRIFVAGVLAHAGSGRDFATAAYSPQGRRLWVRSIDGSAHSSDYANDVVVSANGRRVYSVGSVANRRSGQDAEVAAYRPDGKLVWQRSYAGAAYPEDGLVRGALGPSGRHLYAVGTSGSNYLTICFRRDGHEVWHGTYNGTGDGADVAVDLALSADAQTLYVTGRSDGPDDADVATVAYSEAGVEQWVSRHDSGDPDAVPSIAASPLGELYVATGHDTITTIAYDASGNQLWLTDDAWNSEGARPSDVAVTPDGNAAIVSGNIRDVYWQASAQAYATQ